MTYEDERYGYMSVTVWPGQLKVEYTSIPKPSHHHGSPEVTDSWTLNTREHRLES